MRIKRKKLIKLLATTPYRLGGFIKTKKGTGLLYHKVISGPVSHTCIGIFGTSAVETSVEYGKTRNMAMASLFKKLYGGELK